MSDLTKSKINYPVVETKYKKERFNELDTTESESNDAQVLAQRLNIPLTDLKFMGLDYEKNRAFLANFTNPDKNPRLAEFSNPIALFENVKVRKDGEIVEQPLYEALGLNITKFPKRSFFGNASKFIDALFSDKNYNQEQKNRLSLLMFALSKFDDKGKHFAKVLKVILDQRYQRSSTYASSDHQSNPRSNNRNLLFNILGITEQRLNLIVNDKTLDPVNEEKAELPAGSTQAINLSLLIPQKQKEEVVPKNGNNGLDDLNRSRIVKSVESKINIPDLKPHLAESRVVATLDEISTENISKVESENILKNIKINGSPDGFKGKIYNGNLTPEILKKEGLEPKFKIQIDGKSVYVSSKFYELGQGRIATVAYVQNLKGEFVPRSYYRSNSQGVWRYLPQYLSQVDTDSPETIVWYGKGHSEESVTLPVDSQMALSKLSAIKENVKTVSDPEFIFAGTCRKLSDNAKYSYQAEISASPQFLSDIFKPSFDQNHQEIMKDPSELVFKKNPKDAPDFTKKVSEYISDSTLYGQISVEVFSSKNGKYKYSFCRDTLNRAWIAGIEDSSEVISMGIRKNWILGGNLCTPAYEYNTQSGGYGNNQLVQYPYVDMFKNYLSKIPVIQEYLKYTLNKAK